MTASVKHRHSFTVTRYVQNTTYPLVKRCSCGRTYRWHRGRWTLTAKGGETT